MVVYRARGERVEEADFGYMCPAVAAGAMVGVPLTRGARWRTSRTAWQGPARACMGTVTPMVAVDLVAGTLPVRMSPSRSLQILCG